MTNPHDMPSELGKHRPQRYDWRVSDVRECQGADFSKVAAVLGQGVEDHIRRDRLSPVMAAVFRSRGGHAPGEVCPSNPNPEPVHAMACDLFYDGEWCTCGALR